MTKEEYDQFMKYDPDQPRLLTKAEIDELQHPKVNYSDYVEPTLMWVVVIVVLGFWPTPLDAITTIAAFENNAQ